MEKLEPPSSIAGGNVKCKDIEKQSGSPEKLNIELPLLGVYVFKRNENICLHKNLDTNWNQEIIFVAMLISTNTIYYCLLVLPV